MASPDLKYTRRHISARTIKPYFEALEQLLTPIEVDNALNRLGFDRPYFDDDKNWVSFTFVSEFLNHFRALTMNAAFLRKAGRMGMKPAHIGPTLYLLAKYSLTTKEVYERLPQFASLLNNVLQWQIIEKKHDQFVYSLSYNRSKLSPFENRYMQDEFKLILENVAGYLEAIPTIHGLAMAKVKVAEEVIDVDKITVQIDVQFNGAYKPFLRQLLMPALLASVVFYGSVAIFSLPQFFAGSLSVLFGLVVYFRLKISRAKQGLKKVSDQIEQQMNAMAQKYEELEDIKTQYSERLADIEKVSKFSSDLISSSNLDIAIAKFKFFVKEFGLGDTEMLFLKEHQLDEIKVADAVVSSDLFKPSLNFENIIAFTDKIKTLKMEVGGRDFLYLPIATPRSVVGLVRVSYDRSLDEHVVNIISILIKQLSIVGENIENIDAKMRYAFSGQLLQIENGKKDELVRFARQVAHDIRSPLTALEVIGKKEHAVNDVYKSLYLSALKRVSEIAVNLLKLKNETSKELSDSELNPAVLLKPVELLKEVQVVVAEKQVIYDKSCVIELGERLLTANDLKILGEPIAFKRVLANLIQNAKEACDDNGQILIDVKQVGDDSIELIVQDNGRGIPKNVLPRIFDEGASFKSQTSATLKSSDKNDTLNSGLGLYHAKKTIESWGGQIGVQETSKLGTRFSIKASKSTF